MKRRNFLKGLVAAPFLFTAIKSIKPEPLKEKPKEITVTNSFGGDGGFLVSKEVQEAMVRTMMKDRVLFKRILR